MSSRMKKTFAGTAVAALVLVGGAGLVPTVAAAATGEGSVSSRIERITEALSGLVTDGTLTQEQADKVAQTLDQAMPPGRPGHGPSGPGERRGPGLEAAAEALGLTVDELREQLRSGQTLGEIADAQGVDRDAVVDALVAQAQERLAQAVEDGRLTQEQADERSAQLRSRIEQRLDQAGGMRGRHHGGPPPAAEQDPEPQIEGSST